MRITPDQIVVPAGIALAVGLVFYFLGRPGQPQQIVYPSTGASGQSTNQVPAVAYDLGTRQPAPSPALIYGAPPLLPPTPQYQSYNNSPANLFTLTPEAASAALATPPAAKTDGCCCGKVNQGEYGDGPSQTGLAANPSEQANGMSTTQLDKLASNLATPSLANDGFFWQQIAINLGKVPAQY